MSQLNIDTHIRRMIAEAFDLVKLTYQYQNAANPSTLKPGASGSRMIFPQNKNGKTRVSEQELRFAFAEVFNKYVKQQKLDWYYSIEMPSIEAYGPSGNGKRNALFDFSIVDPEFNRIALIEFKAKNPSETSYGKDLAKLSNPEEDGNADTEALRYFVQIVESHNNGTIKSINDKTTLDNLPFTNERPIHIIVYSLTEGEIIIDKTTVCSVDSL